MGMYKEGTFYKRNNDINITLCGVEFSIDDLSEATKEFISKQIEKGITKGKIVEIAPPIDDEEKDELESRDAEVMSVMENNLFEPEDEDILTCEWKQLDAIL